MKKNSIYSFVKLLIDTVKPVTVSFSLLAREIVNDIAATLSNTALGSQTTSFSTSYNAYLIDLINSFVPSKKDC